MLRRHLAATFGAALAATVIVSAGGGAAEAPQAIPLRPDTLTAVDVALAFSRPDGRDTVTIKRTPTAPDTDHPTFARIKGVTFLNGTIEMSVRSHDATPQPRGFIGLAFRINDDNSRYESFYLRPGNGRIDDQVRRNHTLQYYAFPEFPFSTLRSTSPEKYESHADIGLDEWIRVKVIVNDTDARLFINNAPNPSLVVTDLKHGAGTPGAVALWVDVATEGSFRDVTVTPR